jgi:hypothetical protein
MMPYHSPNNVANSSSDFTMRVYISFRALNAKVHPFLCIYTSYFVVFLIRSFDLVTQSNASMTSLVSKTVCVPSEVAWLIQWMGFGPVENPSSISKRKLVVSSAREEISPQMQ